jgi:RNA recognition motif-containing protein
MPDEIRARMANRGLESPSSQLRGSPGFPRRHVMSPQTSNRRILDYNSIFVGNLPSHVDEHLLRSTFGAYGRIRNVEIVRKPSINRKPSLSYCSSRELTIS